MTHDPTERSHGPYLPDQVRSGDSYELSKGRRVLCNPTGSDGAGPNGHGFAVLDSDPMVKSAAVDPGIDLGERTLRAPDVGVNLEGRSGVWFQSTALALEYAGAGQDERELRTKIAELLDGGTRWVWVVRVTGPRRVEVHEKGAPVRIAREGEELTAPGVLELPVPVRALFDRDAAHETTLRNLLRAQGYDGLEAVRREAELMSAERWREEGREEGSLAASRRALLAVLEARGLSLDAEQRGRVAACDDQGVLVRWLTRASTASEARAVFT